MNISERAKAIINKFLSRNLFQKRGRSLIVSLYSLKDDADKSVVDILRNELVDLNNEIGIEAINLLLSEYKEVVKFVDYREKHNGVFEYRNEELSIREDVVELCHKIADCTKDADVFIPFTGDAEFALGLNSPKVSGFEIMPTRWAYSKILLDAYDIEADIKMENLVVNSRESYQGKKKFDFIFSFPPVLYSKEQDDIVRSIIEWLEYGLNDKGAMCLILPQSATSSSKWLPLRQYLTEHKKNYSVSVISLPRVFEPVSTVETCVLAIDKGYNDFENFIFMDAAKKEFVRYHEFESPYGCLKVDSILDCFNGPDGNYVKEISVSQLTGDFDFDFTPARYFVEDILPKPKKGEQICRLGDIIMFPESRSARNNPEFGKVIGLKELSDDYLKSDLDIDSIQDRDVKGFIPAQTNGCFAGFMSGKMKIGRITKVCKTENVYLRYEVFQFFVKPDSPASTDFILNALLSDYVKAQADLLATGLTIKRLSRKDFVSLKIVVPSMEEQNKILHEDSKASVAAAYQKLYDASVEFRQDIHMIKHAVEQTIFNLNNWVKLLAVARRQGNGVMDDKTEIGTVRKTKVADIYKNIDAAIATLSEQIKNIDMGYGMQSKQIALVDFVHDFIEKNTSPLFTYEFDERLYRVDSDLPYVEIDDSDPANLRSIAHPGEFLLRVGDPIDFVEFPEEALTVILQNIVANACNYGFVNSELENKVRITFNKEGSDLIMVIENNGSPLHNGMTTEDIFRYSFTTGGSDHHGIGGYQIRNLMRKFDGDATAISTPEGPYTLAYKLVFHKTNFQSVNLD